MDNKKAPDAGDAAPRPPAGDKRENAPPSRKQDAPNYDERTDGGRAIPNEDLSSANDE